MQFGSHLGHSIAPRQRGCVVTSGQKRPKGADLEPPDGVPEINGVLAGYGIIATGEWLALTALPPLCRAARFIGRIILFCLTLP